MDFSTELICDKNCFIAPSKREAKALAKMLRSQGDMRGLIDRDGTLIIFDSYGNTHSSAITQLGLKGCDDSLIFRLDGGILTDVSFGRAKAKLEKVFAPEICEVIRAIYHHLDETIIPFATQD